MAQSLRSFNASFSDSAAIANTLPLTPQEALSGIFGSISLASWVFVLVPQLYENYASSSASGISLLFLIVWLFGDVANLIGAVWADLVPTVIALAIYFCFADAVLIAQVVWYEYWPSKWLRTPKRDSHVTAAEAAEDTDEEEPLLGRRESESSIGLPGSHKRHRRRSSAASRTSQTNGIASGDFAASGRRSSSLSKIPEVQEEAQRSAKREVLINTSAVLAICALGALGWVICWKLSFWTPAAAPGDEGGDSPSGEGNRTPLGAEILGYLSAVAYLGARIPQIVKNWREKSTEGLSLLFFMLSLLGNLSYGAGILFHSLEREYVIKNAPWLIGSLGTMVEDFAIFVQFRLYGEGSKGEPEEVEEEAVH